MFFVVLILIAGGAMYVLLSKGNQHAQMANRLGLEVRRSRPGRSVIGGQIGDVPVEAVEEIRVNGRHVRAWHVVKVTIPYALPERLQISCEGMVSGLGKMIGMQDIVVGNPLLDELVVIKGKEPEEVKAFFSQRAIAAATFGLFDRYGLLKLEKNTLSIKVSGHMSAITEQMIVSMVEYVNIVSGKVEYKEYDNKLVEAGLSDMSFAESARFVEEEIARRKALGKMSGASFELPVPEIIVEEPVYQAADDYVAPESDGHW